MLRSSAPIVTLEELKEHLRITDNEDDTRLSALLEEATRYVETRTRQPMSLVDGVQRLSPASFDDSQVILPSGLHSLTSFVDATGEIDPDDLILVPYNGPPYYRIIAPRSLSAPIEITGTWGIKTTPAIKTAVILLVSEALNEAYESGLQSMSTGFANRIFDRTRRSPHIEATIRSHAAPPRFG